MGSTYDPFHFLPLELARMICQNLGLRDLLVCLSVSKDWKSLLESFRALWTTLDTTDVHKLIPIESLEAYLRRSNFALHRAILSLESVEDKHRLQSVINKTRYLKELEIRGGNSLKVYVQLHPLSFVQGIEKLHVSQNIIVTLSVAQTALESCRETLVEVSFSHIEEDKYRYSLNQWPRLDALKSINLRAFNNGVLNINSLLEATPNITNVVLDHFEIIPKDNTLDLRYWSHLERLELTNARLSNFPKLPPKLRHLNLSSNPELYLTVDSERGLIPLPLLRSFSCRWTSIGARSLFAITESSIQAKNLKSLDVGGRNHINTSTLPVWEVFPSSPSLEELSVGCLDLWDIDVLEIIRFYPQLKKLDLSSTLITGATIKALVEKVGIENIVIDYCHKVSFDAVEMARSKGIDVDFRLFPT